MTRTGEVRGLWTLVYFVQRFIVFTINLRWALDPDRYDLDRNVMKVHLGLWKNRFLFGGARIIVPEDVGHTLTFSEGSFRAMLPDEVARHLIQYRLNWIEVTRLYVLGNKQSRGILAKELFRAIYQYGMENERPMLLMVVNDTLLTMFRRYRFAYKVVGAAGFEPVNHAEETNTNSSGLVPHYVIMLNLLASQETVTQTTLTFFNEGLGDVVASNASKLQVDALWHSLEGLSQAEIQSLVLDTPCDLWFPDAAIAVTAAGG